MFDKTEMNYLIEQAEIDLETGWDDDNAFRSQRRLFYTGLILLAQKCISSSTASRSRSRSFSTNCSTPKGWVMRSLKRCGKTLGSSASG
jgi:hypothetical protein